MDSIIDIPNPSWKRYLTRQAKLSRMCYENQAYLGACETKSDAIRLYKQTIDWALANKYPSIDFLRKEFSEQEKDGFFVDHKFCDDMLNDQQCYVFHNCTGKIRVALNYEKQLLPMLYFANGCNMTVEFIGIEYLPITQFPIYVCGENKIKTKHNRFAKVKLYTIKSVS